jgi:DNA-binding IclR family transcriptional regulator
MAVESRSVRSVERAIDILEAISTKEDGAGVSEIAERLGLAKSTVHRLLVALSKKGMVLQPPGSDRYLIGHKPARIALAGAQNLDVIRIAKPYLEELRDATDETVGLALKVGLRYTYVTQASSRNEYRVNPVLGHQYPLHWAATGKVILAFVKDDELEECLKVVPQLRSTSRTVVDPRLLQEQLEQIRHTGLAISFGERLMGAAAVAAPIRNRLGYSYASACIVAPETRMGQAQLDTLAQGVVEISQRIQTLCQVVGVGD